MADLIFPIFMVCLEKRHDILDRRINLDVVGGADDVSAALLILSSVQVDINNPWKPGQARDLFRMTFEGCQSFD